jgi:hypothetical protein
MSKVVLDVSISLDGFTTGPDVSPHEPGGHDGERLREWMAGNGPDGALDLRVRQDVDTTVGAAVIGRRTFDGGVGPWGGTPWPGIPSFVVTHRTRDDLVADKAERSPGYACANLAAALGTIVLSADALAASRTRPACKPTCAASSLAAAPTRPTISAARLASSRPSGVNRIPRPIGGASPAAANSAALFYRRRRTAAPSLEQER